MKGKILHLEDDPEWIEHVRLLLGDKYDLHSVTDLEAAARRVIEVYKSGEHFDLAICDINLQVREVFNYTGLPNRHGLEFLDMFRRFLADRGADEDIDVIVLSGYLELDQNMRMAFRDYRVLDVFDKGNFADEAAAFTALVDKTVAKNRAFLEKGAGES